MSSDLPWPRIDHESLPWTGAGDVRLVSRSEQRRHTGPYRAAVLPTIAQQTLVLPSEVEAEADDASVELTRFDAEMGSEIAPYVSVLLRSESAASSQIENLTASARAIAEAELGNTSRRNAAQVVANTRAMDAALSLAHRIDAASILEMHRALMETIDPDIAGRWRQQQVWVGGGSIGPHQADFVPPHHDRVEAAIDDLVRFIDRDDIPVLAHAAAAHAQFETIHPFPDGNGRTGRALLQAMLRNKGLTRNVTVPISAGLLSNTGAYFAALGAYRDGNPSEIVHQVSGASFRAVENGRQLVTELREVRASWDERIVARPHAIAWRIADLMIQHPVVDASLLVEKLSIQAPNVYRSLDPLVKADVLVATNDARRNRVWRAPEVLAALDAFAARAGRRVPGGR